MRYQTLFALASLVTPLFAGCGIEGSGHVVSELRPVTAFRQIELAGTADVQIVTGKGEIRVTTDDNLQQYVTTRIEGDRLVIDEQNGGGHGVSLRPTHGIEVLVSMPEVPTDLSIGGSGSIAWDGSAVDSGGTLRLDVSGSGSMDIGAKVDEVDLGLGGSGSVRLHGTAGHGEIDVSGSGSVDAYALQLASAHASISGSGSVRLQVSEQLDAEISGSGSIAYRGSPQVKSHISGSGSVDHN